MDALPALPPALLYTPVEAAKLLRISRSTLYTFLSSGELPSVKVGASRRVPREALLSFAQRLPS